MSSKILWFSFFVLYEKYQSKVSGQLETYQLPAFYEIEKELKMLEESEVSIKLLFDLIHYIEKEKQRKEKNKTLTFEEIKAYYEQLYSIFLLLEEKILDI